MRALQEQYDKLYLERTQMGEQLAKRSAQLDLAHSAVNDLQNKMNKQTSEQRLVQTELQGQLRSKDSEVREVDSKYRKKYTQLKQLVNEYRIQMDRYR